MHLWLFASQSASGAQSALVAQDALQAPEPHAYGAHGVVWMAEQLPLPSQPAASVAIPISQVAGRHATVDPANPLHVAPSMPSQPAAEHGSSAVPVAHCGLVP